MKSPYLTLNQQDFIRGLIMAIGSAVFAMVAESVEKGMFTFDWTAIWHTAVAAAMVYLGKNLFSGSKTVANPYKA